MTIADKLREVRKRLDALHSMAALRRPKLLVEKALAALPDPDEVATIENRVPRLMEQREVLVLRAKTAEQERDKLAAAVKEALSAGHNDNCIFCGLKDKALKRGEEES